MTSPPANQGEGPRADHPLHKPFATLVLPMKASTKWEPLSTACSWPPCSAPATHAPFLPTTCGQCGLHCARARTSSRVQKLYTKRYRALSRTRSTAALRHLTSWECNKRRQMTTGKSGDILSSDAGNLRGTRHVTGKGERRSLGTHDPESWRGGETRTTPF